MLEQHLESNYLGLVVGGCHGKEQIETNMLQDREKILQFE